MSATPPAPKDRGVLGWALYDWANSAYATVVVAGFFPVFLKTYWAAELPVTRSTFYLGLATSAASLAVAILAPLVGALADRAGWHKRALIVYAATGVVCTLGLALAGRGQWELALLLYALGTLGWSGANALYDALLTSVADEPDFDRVSALGFSLGYLGGGILFAGCISLTLYPGLLGLPGKAEAVRVGFAACAIWWAIFSIPLLRWVRQPAPTAEAGEASLRAALARLLQTLKTLRSLKTAALFLVAYWLYIDGVDTIIRMAVDYGLAIGLPDTALITALLLTQFVGFPAAIAFGALGKRIGAKGGVLLALLVYLGVCAFAHGMETATEFYVLAATVGLVQGGVQALSRSLFARLIPAEQSAELFGFYNMVGKYAAVIGPTLMGWVAVATGDPRAGILAVAGLIVLGGGMLVLIRIPRTPTAEATP
ncbi:MAG: MFS transporter [Deltaproteobacteria bacterium]|nr:MFS transporter [Deltaproteobacteria bacterium]